MDGFESGRGSFELGLSDGSIAGYGVTLAEPQSTDLSTVLDRGLRTTVGCRRSCSLELQVRVSPTTGARGSGCPRSADRCWPGPRGRLRGDGSDVAAVLRFSRAARRALQDDSSVTVVAARGAWRAPGRATGS